MYMLDTNICVDIIRYHRKPLVSKVIAQPLGTISISSIVLAELQYGAAKSIDPTKNLKALLQFCTPFDVLAFDTHAAAVYGQIRCDLESKGKPIGPFDTLIAAHAISTGAILVTNNLREFNRIKGLRVENWTRS